MVEFDVDPETSDDVLVGGFDKRALEGHNDCRSVVQSPVRNRSSLMIGLNGGLSTRNEPRVESLSPSIRRRCMGMRTRALAMANKVEMI